jgi:hypothetical protein
MEIHQAGVRLPPFNRSTHAGVVQRSRTPKPSSQSLLSAHIIARKHVQPSNASQQHVLGSPSADAAQFEQALPDHGVVLSRD